MQIPCEQHDANTMQSTGFEFKLLHIPCKLQILAYYLRNAANTTQITNRNPKCGTYDTKNDIQSSNQQAATTVQMRGFNLSPKLLQITRKTARDQERIPTSI